MSAAMLTTRQQARDLDTTAAAAVNAVLPTASLDTVASAAVSDIAEQLAGPT